MNTKPCLFIRGIKKENLEEFQSIKKFGYPIVVLAKDLQLSPDLEELMAVLGDDHIHILSNDVDHKDHELREVLNACDQKEWTHICVIEELFPEIIEKIPEAIEKCLSNPEALIVLNTKSDVSSQQVGRIKSALLGGINYNHLMTPFCCYSVQKIKGIKFKKKSPFLFLKILCSLLWRQSKVLEVEVGRAYQIKASQYIERLWLAYYETLLICIANFMENTKPKNAAISCGVGAFIACTPFYGLQTIAIFLTCVLFRLNFPIAFLGSQVSLPPIYSLLLPIEIYIGFKVMGKPFTESDDWLQVAQDHFSLWLVGALIVGSILGLLLGVTWYCVQTLSQKNKESFNDREC